ncbi:MAG: PDZ domain-containing protein, partial [Pseudomonadota bacterium]
ELQRSYAGIRFDTNRPDRVAAVLADSPAQQAGVSAGDQLIAVDGLKTARERFERILRRAEPGVVLTLHLFRRDELITTSVTLAPAQTDTVWLTIDEDAKSDVRQRLQDWLG